MHFAEHQRADSGDVKSGAWAGGGDFAGGGFEGAEVFAEEAGQVLGFGVVGGGVFPG